MWGARGLGPGGPALNPPLTKASLCNCDSQQIVSPILNQSIVNRNYIENEALVSIVDFRVQSTVFWESSICKCFRERKEYKKKLKTNFSAANYQPSLVNIYLHPTLKVLKLLLFAGH